MKHDLSPTLPLEGRGPTLKPCCQKLWHQLSLPFKGSRGEVKTKKEGALMGHPLRFFKNQLVLTYF
jgi:hypothetical protein